MNLKLNRKTKLACDTRKQKIAQDILKLVLVLQLRYKEARHIVVNISFELFNGPIVEILQKFAILLLDVQCENQCTMKELSDLLKVLINQAPRSQLYTGALLTLLLLNQLLDFWVHRHLFNYHRFRPSLHLTVNTTQTKQLIVHCAFWSDLPFKPNSPFPTIC